MSTRRLKFTFALLAPSHTLNVRTRCDSHLDQRRKIRCGPYRREILGQTAFGHLAEHGMQAADRPGTRRGELMVSSRERSPTSRSSPSIATAV
jgi:hypothetical protein